jgi:hypothetical protein
MKVEFKYRDSAGNIKPGYMQLEDYQLGTRTRMGASAVVNARHSDADPAFGTAFEQGMKYLGIYPKGDPKFGILPTTIGEVLSGECVSKLSGIQAASMQMAGGTVVSPMNPTGSSTPATRIFFPEVVMNIMEASLRADYGMEESAWNQMFAMEQSIAGPVFTQPVITTSAPAMQDMRPMSQNALPTNMVSITSSQTSYSVGTISIGLQISDEALQNATVDLVGIIVREQAMGARLRMLFRDLGRVVSGNPDSGQGALSATGFKATYDSAAASNTITHKGWLKVLFDPDRVYGYNFILGDMDAYLSIQNRTGRPVASDPTTSGINTGNAGTYGLDTGTPMPINFATDAPRYLICPTGVVAANTVVLFDSRYALARVTNVNAAYSAVEQMVLQRTTNMRFDMSEFVYRLRPEAFLNLNFTNP